MQTESRKTNEWLNASRQMVLVLVALIALVVVSIWIFLSFYRRYDNEILYAERLNQMQEVTEQLFSGLEDVVHVQWDNARYQCNVLKESAPETVEAMLDLMRRQSDMAELERKQSDLIAIDEQGRYYYRSGKQGLMVDMSYLNGRPMQVSYVFNEMTTDRSRMLFLYRLEEPLPVRDDEQTVRILYYGIAEDMEQLNPYFDCKAYNGGNSTYVVDKQGLKLFSGESNSDLLEGFNVFSVLRNMQYLHRSSFDETLHTMQENGLAYSNTILNGEEYYYALYEMDSAEWILLFLVPSRFVAINTVQLVDTTTNMLMLFAILMAVACAAMIYVVLRFQQRKALQVANETNIMLEASNRELEQAQTAAEDALKVAKSASKAKSEFLANMSHDIRTPMNAIVGITRLMEHDKNDPQKVGIYVEKVQQSSQHLLSLINDVLDMSKIESGDVMLNSEPIGLADQIGQVESIIRPQVEERKQHFAIHIRNITHEYLIGDAVRLRQVLLNLLSNAIKYTPNGGYISLDFEELPSEKADRAKLRIAVTDSGYGMAPEFMAHIFEPFTRAENSTTNRVQGTGLGMAITKNIVDLAGGTISIQSEVNHGSRFTVELPLLIDPKAKTTIPVQNVLLITDDDGFAENVRTAFRETDAALTVARSEEEADTLLRQSLVDVVLLSGSLNGQTLADNVQRLRPNTGNALLFYCCNYDERDQLAALSEKGGTDGIIVRPFFLSSLETAIDCARTSAQTAAKESDSILKGKRFLCAEDNALNAEILEAVLDMNGASCVIYPDGQKLVDAFAAVKPDDFDAILMDVQMPVMNGLDATRAIRRGKNPLGQTIPIIAMTANAFSEDVQNCLNAGMDAHVAKPLDLGTLERTLKSVAGGKFAGGGSSPRSQKRE